MEVQEEESEEVGKAVPPAGKENLVDEQGWNPDCELSIPGAGQIKRR